MLETMTRQDAYQADFDRLEAASPAAPAWLTALRRAGMTRFAETGFPSARDEEWRTTNVARIAHAPFRLAASTARAITEDDLAPYTLGRGCCTRLVFVNGAYAPALSSAPEGLGAAAVGPLADSLRLDVVERNLGGAIALDDGVTDAFAALNTAFLTDGALVHVPADATLEKPIEILHVTTAGAEPAAVYPRTLIVAGARSSVTVVERHVGLEPGGAPRLGTEDGRGADAAPAYLSCAVTEIIADEGARVDHYRTGRESPHACHVGLTRIVQQADSDVASKTITLGGALVRNNMHATLAGEHGNCNLRGLTIAGQDQLIDNHLRVEHAMPNCDSREFFKNIVDGRGRVVFTGRIYVAQDAQKTDAKQTNMSLLLTDDGQVNALPQLEIYADDVKCTHGATVGELDADALFYLRARGIDPQTARALLIYAFAAESLDEVALPELRRQLEAILFERLPGGRSLSASM
jgi:Fe-S cluster assembly protein SufD